MSGIDKINLNFNWKYINNYNSKYLSENFDFNNFESVNIPHANIELPYNNFDEKLFQFTSTYIKDIFIPNKYKDKSLILRFDGAATYALVYLNGEKIGQHKGGYTSFSFDISDKLKFNSNNRIIVILDSSERPEIPPFGHVIDYLTYGGIYREVYIDVHEKGYISNLFITPKNVLTKTPLINFKFLFKNKPKDKKIKITVKDLNDNVILKKEIIPDNLEVFETTFEIQNIKLWDIENPVLYEAIIIYNGNRYTEKFGFREAIFKNSGFYLNGKKLKLRGLNRHQAYPYVGYAMPKSAQESDALFLKYDLGLNIVRTSHYPQSKHFINKCDEIGLLVFTEIPGWQHIGPKGEWWDITLNHVSEMITQYYNHPSIILWGVRINESIDNDELYTKTNNLARKLDPSRQTGGVRYFANSSFLEDVYTMNDFVHSGGEKILTPKKKVCKNKPYLVTEYNGHMFPTKSFDHEKKRQEHALRHARVLNEMYKMDGLSGCIGWCMSDYNTHKDFGSGDKICYHGVSDMFRIKKLAGYVYQAQQDKIPVLEITSNMEIGDCAGGVVGDVYIITNCDKVVISRNDKKLVTYDIKEKAKNTEFVNLPHPLIKIDDLIGSQIEDSGKFTLKDSKKIKSLLLQIEKVGIEKAIRKNLIFISRIIRKYKLTQQDIKNLYDDYVQSWGGEQKTYKFEGYINNKKVITVTKGSVTNVKLEISADNIDLLEKDTYDTTRITIKALSQLNNVLPYSNDSISIKTKGPIELIGPSNLSLIGGVRGVWVKTIGKSGKAKIIVESESLKQKQEILLNVKKEKI